MTTPPPPNPEIGRHDRQILRRLAGRVAELARRPIEQEKRSLWHRHNALIKTRPLVFCDPENGWNEIIPPDSLECEGEPARGWEWRLKREIFWGEQIQDDRVILPEFTLPHVFTESDWGMHHRIIGGAHGGSYVWESPLTDYADMNRLRFPQITVDHAATARQLEQAHAVFDGLLNVNLKTGWWWSLGLTWTLVNLRGLQQIMLDMVDRPAYLHRLMAFLRNGTLARIQWLESNALLFLNNAGDYVGSGGFGWTEELPRSDFNGKARLCDMWGFCESQETVGVSPAMFEDFVFQYQLPILERFGLNCYGCCEPLDTRWNVVKQTPHLRRVSVSPWSNLEKMAGNLADRYLFSMKPNPAKLAAPSFDERAIRAELRNALCITRDCCVEVIMKDCHTLNNDPMRAVRWTRIACEEAERL